MERCPQLKNERFLQATQEKANAPPAEAAAAPPHRAAPAPAGGAAEKGLLAPIFAPKRRKEPAVVVVGR